MEGKILNNDVTLSSTQRYNNIIALADDKKMSYNERSQFCQLADEHAQKNQFTLYFDNGRDKIIDGDTVRKFERLGLIVKQPPKKLPNSDKFYVRKFYKFGLVV